MVDALREAWRVLAPSGLLVDLRPIASSTSPLDLVTPQRAVQVGEIDASAGVGDDLAADRAIGQAVAQGWLLPGNATGFEFEYYWGTVDEMASFIDSSERTWRVRPSYTELKDVLRARMAASGRRARLRTRRPMQLAVYRRGGVGQAAGG